MTPKAKEQRSAGELEEDSYTRRKRSRRVSFAETTVHIFKRDEESESPATSTPVPSEGCRISDSEETVGFRGIQSQGDDSVDSSPEQDADEDGARLRFLRDMDSSSPGSAVGSVTSNEDDNFFGPVSTNFINSGRLSESGMSDDNNHDITLDSTAFSLHFRNIAPPDDHSANSANSSGSLRTPTEDTTRSKPRGFLVRRDQTEELPSKCSAGKMSDVCSDWKKITPTVGGSHSYDYGKLSLTLEALVDQVNLRMQHNSQNGDCAYITSSHQTDEVEGIRQSGKDRAEVGDQISYCDERGRVIHCSFSPVPPSTSNESLLHAKANTLTIHSKNEKMQEMFSPLSADRFEKVHEAIHPEDVVANGQISKVLSPSHGEPQTDLNGQSCHIHQELFRSTSEDKSNPDSSLHSISAVLSLPEDAEQKLESVSMARTPKNASKLFHSSALQETTPLSHGQEQQQFLNQTTPSSSKFLRIYAREKPVSRMETPDNAVKAFQFSSLQGSIDISVLSQSELMHNPAREQSTSLRRELMEHGERISAIENHITTSKVKSRTQFNYGPAPSNKDLFVAVLQCIPNGIIDDPSVEHADISAVNLNGTTVTSAKHAEGMNIIKDLNCSGNISYFAGLDKNAALESMDISMKTPDNTVKAFQFSTLQGSISSFQDKQRQLQYRSILSQTDSLHSSARELSASLKMELIEHGERISAIKTSISRSRFKSTMQTDCEVAPSRKDLFITDLQGSLNEINDDPCMRHAGISNGHMDANEVSAAKQMEGLDIVKGLNCYGNGSCLTGLDENVAFLEMIEKDQSEKCIEFYCDNSFELPHTLDPCDSSIDQRAADLKESNQEISNKYASANRDKSALSLEGCFTPRAGEVTSSCDLFERKNLQPATSLSSAEKIAQCPNNHSFNKMDLVSPKKSQVPLSYFHGSSHRSMQSEQETYYGCDVAIIGDIGKKQTYHTENAGYSESYRMQNSPVTVLQVVGDSMIMSKDHMHHDEALDIAGKAQQKRWTDVFSKLSDATNQLLPQSISELNLHKLDDLEDLLDELQTARKYEGLCITLRNQNRFSDQHQKRVIDARSLLEKLGFSKARKQLKCMKLKKLRNKAQILQSKVEECDKLKSIYTPLCDLSTRAIESDESSHCKSQEEQNRLMAMKLEFGILEQNIKLLLKSFEASCKITGKMSCNDVINAANEHVLRRAFCKDIQQHAQLWKLSDVVMKNDYYEIVLGYCNLLFQRFMINKNHSSSIVTNILCNAANIIKKYPNMKACIAFEFVFKLNVDDKLANSNCIYGRTVETNLRMGTLIDVLEEILLSQLELLNLIFSTFLKQSSGELELQLCFCSSSSGRKIILGIDMTSLNCGVYPSDPSEVKMKVCEQQTTLPSSIVNNVIGAVRSLDCGHLMILRLCRCVSQVVQCSS